MDSNAKDILNSSEALIKDAEEYAEGQISEIKEERSRRRKNLILLGSMMVLTVLILVFTTIAWFAMNEEVSAGSMAVTATDAPFEIATKGTNVRYASEFESADSEYTDGVTTTITGIDHMTSPGDQAIRLRYDPTAAQLEKEDEIGPDSSGQIDLYIVPRQNGTMTVRFDLRVVAFRAFTKTVGNTTTEELIRMSDLTVENSGLTQAKITESQKAETYLNGHILFFEHQSSSPSLYSYTDPITDGVLEHTFTAAKNVPEKVTIYWMWTNTLGQLAIKDSSNQLLKGIPAVQNIDPVTEGSDKEKILDYLKTYKDRMFKNLEAVAALTDAEKEGLDEDEIAAACRDKVDDRIDDADDPVNFKLLSEGYNSADFVIGTNVDYFIVEIIAS